MRRLIPSDRNWYFSGRSMSETGKQTPGAERERIQSQIPAHAGRMASGHHMKAQAAQDVGFQILADALRVFGECNQHGCAAGAEIIHGFGDGSLKRTVRHVLQGGQKTVEGSLIGPGY